MLVASPNSDAFIIYLTAPALLAGLRSGIYGSFAVVGVQSVTLLALQAQLRDIGTGLLDLAGPWLMTGFAAGLLGAWIRQLRLVQRDTLVTPYASAHRLLGQLRTITRELPGGLDIDVVSEDVLSNSMEQLGGTAPRSCSATSPAARRRRTRAMTAPRPPARTRCRPFDGPPARHAGA